MLPEDIGETAQDIIRVQDEYYIKASSTIADQKTHVLKQNEIFCIADRFGDFHPVGLGEQGLYYNNTRFLQRLEIKFFSKRFLLLGSEIKNDNILLNVDMTNPDLVEDNKLILERDFLHLVRSIILYRNCCYQRFRFHNYDIKPITCDFSLYFGSDFADVFEIRGVKREKRGHQLSPEIQSSSCTLGYQGLDKIERRTQLTFSPEPKYLSSYKADFSFTLAPNDIHEIDLTISCEEGFTKDSPHFLGVSFSHAYSQSLATFDENRKSSCELYSSSKHFNEWIDDSAIDMYMMLTETEWEQSAYPYAGIPWFSAPFGRDGVITALETLWYNPSIAKNVLRFLAKTQAMEKDDFADAEPGKIIHEMRKGEMASLKEVPFGR